MLLSRIKKTNRKYMTWLQWFWHEPVNNGSKDWTEALIQYNHYTTNTTVLCSRARASEQDNEWDKERERHWSQLIEQITQRGRESYHHTEWSSLSPVETWAALMFTLQKKNLTERINVKLTSLCGLCSEASTLHWASGNSNGTESEGSLKVQHPRSSSVDSKTL